MKVYKDEQDAVSVSRTGFFEILALIAIGFFLFCVIFIYQSVYVNHYNTNITRLITQILPLPAGTVNSEFIMYKDVFALDQLAQIEFSNEDHFSHAIDAVVKQIILSQIVEELGVMYEFDDSSVIDPVIYEQYGWSGSDYDDYVLLPMQESEALQGAVLLCLDCQQSVRIEVEHVSSLIKTGILFEDLAKQYSQVASSQFGGDIGYLAQDELDDELYQLWDYQIGEVSDVLELKDRFVIASVYDTIESDGVRELIGVQMIVMYKNGLQEVLEEDMQNAEIKIFGK